MAKSTSFSIVRFGVIACVLLVGLYVLSVQVGLVGFLNHANAQALNLSLRTMGFPSEVSGDMVDTGRMRLLIITECTGLYSLLILAAGILAYPAPVMAKVVGLLLGLPFVMAVNLFRLVTLALIGHYWSGIFHASHVYLWQVTLLLMIVLTWVFWARYASRYATRSADTTHTSQES